MCQYHKYNKKDPETWSECQEIIKERFFSSLLQDWICSNKKPSDEDVFAKYTGKDCNTVREELFPHSTPTQEEKNFPIAYAVVVFKSANLVEKVLQSIYMPHNIYCIHVDVKSSDTFRNAVKAMAYCLDNVFITSKPVNLIWSHVSTLYAQRNCLRELMESPVKWKYFMHISGQELPLYTNFEIVRALVMLNGFNNIESFAIPPHNWGRMQYSFEVKKVKGREFHENYVLTRTEVTKPQPPWNISIQKGSNFVAITREAANYILHDQVPIDFLGWLNDTAFPDEAFYSSLQQHPGFPGGIHGDQPDWILRAVSWQKVNTCYGWWIRGVCWVTTRDLIWILGSTMRRRLFVTKIPFEYRDDLLECLSIARTTRKYGQDLFPVSGVS